MPVPGRNVALVNGAPTLPPGLGHRLISAHPDSCSCEFDECEIVGGVLLVPGRDGSEVLELVEEALDAVSRSVQEGAEGGFVEPAGQRLDVGEDAPCRHVLAEKVAVVGAVGDQDLAGAEALKHIGCSSWNLIGQLASGGWSVSP